MVYSPTTDFLGLWRNNGGQVSKLEMPGLDYVVAALARAGVITLAVSATAPVVGQNTTAWLKAAVPSYSAEGALHLWDAAASAYAPATPALFFEMLQAAAGQSGASWWTCEGGPPLNTVGNNGDFAIQLDEPGGVYGPKASGAWPADPIPGTTGIISSTQLDLTFGDDPGMLIARGATAWQALPIGGANTVLRSTGAAPDWEALSALFDAVFDDAQGSVLYRGAGAWAALGPGADTQVLTTGGPGSNPAWAPRTAEFPSGTKMLFQQTAAPPGWTKQTALNDYGLRVVSGVVGSVAGSAFSTVFAQTAVGDTTLTIAQMPSHGHPYTAPGGPQSVDAGSAFPLANIGAAGSTTGGTGGDDPHTHSVNLTLSYVDVIIASKD